MDLTKDASTTLVFIRPVPADLLTGRLDTRIKAFLRTACSFSCLPAVSSLGARRLGCGFGDRVAG